jgi:hypothetical protein
MLLQEYFHLMKPVIRFTVAIEMVEIPTLVPANCKCHSYLLEAMHENAQRH